MLGLNEAIVQLPMANSVPWYGNALEKEDGNVLRSTLVVVVEGQRKKRRQKRTWKKMFEGKKHEG